MSTGSSTFNEPTSVATSKRKYLTTEREAIPDPVEGDAADPLNWNLARVREEDPKGKCPVDLSYQTFGDKANTCVLLVMGHNASGVIWASNFCQAIADAGYFVIRFDNRDIGYSTKFDHMKCPPMWHLLMPDCCFGWSKAAPYQLKDMAEDAALLLTHLGIEKAHWVGESMGGMIVQTGAIHFPEKVISMVSLSSTTGNQKLPDPTFKVKQYFLKKPKSDKLEDVVDHRKEFFKGVLCAGLNQDDKMLEDAEYCARMALHRSRYEGGATRQMFAIRNAPNRDPMLAQLQMPTLVIHGRHDVLVPTSHGEHTAKMIRSNREEGEKASLDARHPPLAWIESLSHGAGAWAQEEVLSHLIPWLDKVPSLPPAYVAGSREATTGDATVTDFSPNLTSEREGESGGDEGAANVATEEEKVEATGEEVKIESA